VNHFSVVFVTFACFGIGSTIAWSNLASPAGGPTHGTKAAPAGSVGPPAHVIISKVDFDQAFADAAAARGEFKPSTVIGFTIARANAGWSVPAYVTRTDFDQAFADAAAGHRELTPPMREKLRDAGWKSLRAIEGVSDSLRSSGLGINRQRKSDRLPIAPSINYATAPDPSPSVSKNAGSTVGQSKVTIQVPKLPPEPPVDCEPVASRYVDPVLGHIIGRCIT